MTPPLHGAWSLDGAPLDEALLARLEAAAQGAVTLREGPLWLAAAPGNLGRAPGALAAYEGFVVEPERSPAALAAGLADDGARRPRGHFVAVRAEPASRRLTLWRDPSGGERLFFLRRGGALLFSSSLPRLAAMAGEPLTLDRDVAVERGLAELAQFGDRTLLAGAREVLPGHRLTADADLAQRWDWGPELDGREGDERQLLELLRDGVGAAIGSDGSVAISLSGGIDSSAIAALAVERVGAANVHAFSYEFDDPEHPSESEHSRRLCRHLGIRHHEIVRLTFEEYLDAVPEAVWRAEDPAYWKRGYIPPFARRVRERGFAKFLTGFGIGSHMAYLDDLGSLLASWPVPAWALRRWLSEEPRQPETHPWRAAAHPGLAPPFYRLRYPIVAALRGAGLTTDAASFFPEGVGALVEEQLSSERVLAETRGAPSGLARRLQRSAFLHVNSCLDIARGERLSREAGAAWVAPAHFAPAIPLCYFPPRPRPALWTAARRARPGKSLLVRAMRGMLPESIIARRKYYAHPVGSRGWRDRALERMASVSQPSLRALDPLFGGRLEAARRHNPEAVVPLAFWHRLFAAGETFSSPPSWAQLSSR